MRRLLTALVAATPLIASAQTAGQILFDSKTINRTQCQGTDEIRLDFALLEQATGSFVAGTGEVTLYSASADKTDSVFPPCHYEGDGSTGVTVGPLLAQPISNPAGTTGWAIGPMATMVSQAGFDCTTADKTIYVCAIWKNSASEVKAYAKGSVSLKVALPPAPVIDIDSIGIGDTRLSVKIKPPTGTPLATDFRARAVAWDAANAALDPGDHFSSLEPATGEATIEKLVNGVSYRITAFAYTVEGNVSGESSAVGPYMPRPIQDAWEHYVALGGTDSGGCQAGGAGLAALLGAAALLRLRRRA